MIADNAQSTNWKDEPYGDGSDLQSENWALCSNLLLPVVPSRCGGLDFRMVAERNAPQRRGIGSSRETRICREEKLSRTRSDRAT